MIWTFIITIVVVMIAIRLLVVYNDKVKFFSTGSDNGFRFKEIRMLWHLAKMTELEDPQALYISVPTLNQAISHIITDATNKGIQDTPEIQGFLSKLYKFRTKLNIEKEIIGSYVSGHPLDEYGKVISTCVTLSSKNMDRAAKEDKAFKESLAASGANSWANRNSGKMYTVLGFLQNLRQIHTKTGKDMAFAKLQDYDGEIDLTFFSKTWESLSSKLQSGNVYAFKGRVDGTREQPSFIVDSLEDVASLKTKSISEIHIELEKNITSPELEFSKIREILFAQTGSCSVYFHLDTVQGSYIVQANPQLTVSSSDETIKVLKEMNIIKDVWTA